MRHRSSALAITHRSAPTASRAQALRADTPDIELLWSNPREAVEVLSRIHEIENDERRNNEITRAYELLALDLAEFCQSTPSNWCSTAQWASKTIGIGIRWATRDTDQLVNSGEVGLLDRWASRRAMGYSLACRGLRLFPTARRRVGRALADGNRDVFFEIGAGIEKVIQRCAGQRLTDGEITQIVAAIDPIAPAGSLGPAPESMYREGLACYARAHQERDEGLRNELALAGDLMLAMYEQMRLQPVIEEVFFAAPDAVLGRPRSERRVRDRGRRAARRAFALMLTNTVLVYATHDQVFSLAGGQLRAAYDGPTHPALQHVLEVARSLEPEVAVRRLPWTDARRRMISATGIIQSLHGGGTHAPFSLGETSAIFEIPAAPVIAAVSC